MTRRATEAAIDAAAIRLRIRPEFKFNKCRDDIRDAFFEAVRPFDFCVREIVVQKELIYSRTFAITRGVVLTPAMAMSYASN